MSAHQHNIQTFVELINETRQEGHTLNPDWVLLMLEILKSDRAINPQWLRAGYGISFNGRPPEPTPPMWIIESKASSNRQPGA